MTKVLILSDTHGYCDRSIEKYASSHDEVWHAGDWGDISVFNKLSKIAKTKGVYGNIDGQDIRLECPEILSFKCEGVSVFIKHIGGYPGRYNPITKKQIQDLSPKLVICGHSHILKVMYDKSLNHLHINPGAAGISGFHKVRTMISLEINGEDMRNLKVIEFDKFSHS